MIPCLLVLFSIDVLRTILCRLVCRNLVELNFVKTGLKCKFGVNPQSFSHELSLYVQYNEIRDARAADHMVRFTMPSPAPVLHTASDQKLEPGKAWE